MRLRAIIIDDEETGIETLKLLIEKHIDGVKIIAQSVNASEAIDMIENYLPDIVFLDISMPEMDGFEMLEKLKWKNFDLVFTTAHQEYGLKALKNSAIDYLLKPIDHKDLKIAVEKIKAKINLQQKTLNEIDYTPLNMLRQLPTNKLAVNSKQGVEYLDVTEIISLESKSNYTLISLNNNKTILTAKTLKEFENQLCNNKLHYVRVHNSFIINLHKVLRYIKDTDEITMTNNQKIPLSKSRKDTFFKWLEI